MKKLRGVGNTGAGTPLGAALLVMVAGRVVLVFVGSGTTAKVGFGVAVAGLVTIIGANLPAGLVGGLGGGGSRSPRRRLTEAQAPEPEYIESTAPVSEDAWRREQQRYREQDQDR